jgi:hypothetical protein
MPEKVQELAKRWDQRAAEFKVLALQGEAEKARKPRKKP